MPENEPINEEQTDQDLGNCEPDLVPAIDGSTTTTVGQNNPSSQAAAQRTLSQEEDRRIETPDPGSSSTLATADDQTTGRSNYPDDFPVPPAANDLEVFEWNDSHAYAEIYPKFGKRAASTKRIYRRFSHGGGAIYAPEHANAPPVDLDDTTRFQAALLDTFRVNFMKNGKTRGGFLPTSHLRAMLRSELFLRELPAVDDIVNRAVYLPPDFIPTTPGYNDRGFGHRVLHVGPPISIARHREALDRFLDIMAFESPADRANTYAACLTVLLRNFWAGGKPIVVVTANKSQSGKETLISCIAGLTPLISVSYQPTNWAFERSFVGALRQDPRVGVVNVDNARLEGSRYIRSAFLERFLTDPQPFLFSTGTGGPARVSNNIVVTMSSNEGSLSPDLMNRGLPIRLASRGDVLRRRSPIGNPRYDYLPRHREQIEAELHGMIANWRDAGYPLATDIIHPFGPWAQTIGGILRANGIEHFLENLDTRHNVDDLVRRSLGLLGAAHPDEWRTASEWSKDVVDLGLVKTLIPEADRDGDQARARGTGVTLSAHLDESFDVETEDHVYKFKLNKLRKRFPDAPPTRNTQPTTKYQFEVIERREILSDPGADE